MGDTRRRHGNEQHDTYAVNGKQYVMIFTGGGQSVTFAPFELTKKNFPKAVMGHNAVYVFALP